MHLIVRLVIADKRLGSLAVRRCCEVIVAVAVHQFAGSLTVGESHRLAVQGEGCEGMVIDHFHVVQIDVVVIIGLVKQTTGRIGRAASGLVVGRESDEHVRRRGGVHRRVFERHGDTLPAHVRRGGVVHSRVRYLDRGIRNSLGVLVPRVGGHHRMHTGFVLTVGRVLVRRDILRPEDERVRVAVEGGVMTAVGRVGEIIVASSIVCRHRAGINLSVGAVSVRFGAHHYLRLNHRTVCAGGTRTGVGFLRELLGVLHEGDEITRGGVERVPACRFAVGPIALETAVGEFVIGIGDFGSGEKHQNRLRQRGRLNGEQHLRRRGSDDGVVGIDTVAEIIEHVDACALGDGFDEQSGV